MTEDTTVTGPELADWLGVAAATVPALAREDQVTRAARGRYRLKESVQTYVAAMRASAAGRASPTAGHKARLLAAQAELAETKAKTMAGELLLAAEVEAAWSGVLRTVRAGMLAVPTRVAARLPHLTPEDMVAIDGEVRTVLTELGNGGVA